MFVVMSDTWHDHPFAAVGKVTAPLDAPPVPTLISKAAVPFCCTIDGEVPNPDEIVGAVLDQSRLFAVICGNIAKPPALSAWITTLALAKGALLIIPPTPIFGPITDCASALSRMMPLTMANALPTSTWFMPVIVIEAFVVCTTRFPTNTNFLLLLFISSPLKKESVTSVLSPPPASNGAPEQLIWVTFRGWPKVVSVGTCMHGTVQVGKPEAEQLGCRKESEMLEWFPTFAAQVIVDAPKLLA